MRNLKQVIILILVISGLAGLATWDEWKSKKEESDKDTAGRLTAIKADQVVGIDFYAVADGAADNKTATIEAPSSKSSITQITMRKVNQRWEITAPIQERADQQTVADLIKNLTEYKTETEVTADRTKWADFGMLNPRRKIELETSDGQKTSVFIGINSPVGFSVYSALSSSDKVFSGSQYIATSTAKTLFDFRDKSILELSAADVKSFAMTSATESLKFAKSDEKWTISGSTSAAGDATSIKNLLDDLAGLKAAEFIDNPDSSLKSALNPKKPSLSFEIEGAKPYVIKIFELKDVRYAQVEGRPTIYKLHDDIKAKLFKTAKDLRSRQIFDFQSSQIDEVTIDGEKFKGVGTDWYLEKDAQNFDTNGKFTGKDEAKPSSKSHIRGLLVDFEFARAEETLDLVNAKKLPNTPDHKVIFHTKDGKEIISEIWRDAENPEMLLLVTSSKLFKVKRTLISSLSPAAILPAGNEAVQTPNLSN